MALIFLGVPIIFNASISSFTNSNGRDFIASNEWFLVHMTSIHWIISLGEMLESYYKLQSKLKQFPSLQMHFS